MKRFNVTSVEELDGIIQAEGDGALFRGQINHFEVDGLPSFKTSFQREGCIPSEMLKWCHFSKEVLDYWFKITDATKDDSQAALQHYGWRSFYLDATSQPGVAAWFASHSFKSRIALESCEDHEERPAWMRKKGAWYDREDGIGHLYILDRDIILATVGAVDLTAYKIEGCRPRFAAQSAWLVGPLGSNKPVPTDSVRVHVTGDRAIFREYAARESLVEVNDLFPPAHEDPLLRSFLSLPWLEIKAASEMGGLRAFRRAIEFPEYHDSFDKHLSPSIALFSGERLKHDEDDTEGQLIVVPISVAVGSADPLATKFPNILALLAEKKGVIFEVDYLSRHPGQENTALFGKGFYTHRHDDGLIEVGELMVRHPGYDLIEAGKNQGWFYRVEDDGTWTRERHQKECPCGNNNFHMRHLSALTMIEAWLTDPWPLDV